MRGLQGALTLPCPSREREGERALGSAPARRVVAAPGREQRRKHAALHIRYYDLVSMLPISTLNPSPGTPNASPQNTFTKLACQSDAYPNPHSKHLALSRASLPPCPPQPSTYHDRRWLSLSPDQPMSQKQRCRHGPGGRWQRRSAAAQPGSRDIMPCALAAALLVK